MRKKHPNGIFRSTSYTTHVITNTMPTNNSALTLLQVMNVLSCPIVVLYAFEHCKPKNTSIVQIKITLDFV